MEAIPEKRFIEIAEREFLSRWLPYIGYEKGLYLLADGSLGFIFEINPLLEAGSDTMKIVAGFYNSEFLPAGSTVQWHVFASEDINSKLESWKYRRSKQFRRFCEERVKLYKTGIANILGLPPRDFKFLVSVKVPPPSSLETKGFLERGDGNIDFDGWGKYAGEAAKIQESVKGVLESAFLMPADFPPHSLIAVLREAFNPESSSRGCLPHGYRDDEEIREQILDYETKVKVSEKGIYLNDHVLESLTPRMYPEVFHVHALHELFGDSIQGLRQIPCYFFLTASFIILDREKARMALTGKASVVKHQSFGFLTNFIPRLKLKSDNFDIIAHAFENGETVVKGYMNLFIRGRNENEAERLKELVRGIWRSKNFELQEDRYIMFPLLLNALPLGLDAAQEKTIRRAKTMQASAAASLTPVAMDWKGTGDGPLMFISRRGQMMHLDFFNSRTNFNSVVFATSGAGKSFLTSEIIAGYLGEGATVFVIDVGRSYEKLCSFLDGDFMVFSENSSVSLNPFSEVERIEDEMEILKPLMCQMASPAKPLDDLHKSYMEQAIRKAWDKKGRDTEVDDVVKELMEMEDPNHRTKDLAQMLYPFSSSGHYGKFFLGTANISFKKHLTVVELEELKGKKELQQVVLLLMIYHIGRAMFRGEKSKKKIAVVDEAWDLLGGDMTAEFISHGYRRARKYNGAFISITQSLLDFYRAGNVGEAIIENSSWMLMLRQKAESIEEIKKGRRMLLSRYFSELVESVSTSPGKFSEVFIYNGEQGMGLGRFVVDPFSYWLYTTKADEVGLLNSFMGQGLGLEEAIEKCIEVKGGGR